MMNPIGFVSRVVVVVVVVVVFSLRASVIDVSPTCQTVCDVWEDDCIHEHFSCITGHVVPRDFEIGLINRSDLSLSSDVKERFESAVIARY